ncbi:glycosyltransferase [Cetobacterium somerae]|uniref:glycosyltransferase n=1 Tax=Cetobacterium somerae TaxID=188913 RepID=UPI001F06AF62|nr:glycosyltransferase [Cetobacterium somerae]UPO97388.1 glycosyltransferase [Cetobacterium somerae]
MMEKNKKKILFSIDTLLVGGIEKVLIELLSNISKEKYEITLLIGYKLNELEKLKEDIPMNIKIEYIFKENIHILGKKKKAMGNLKGYEKIIFEITSLLRKKIFKKRLLKIVEKVDTVVDFDMTLASYAKDISKNIITFCHFSPKNYNRGIKKRQERLGEKLKNYNKIVVISKDMEKEGIEIFPFLKEKFITIYNSFNIDLIERKSNLIKEDELNLIKKPYILSIGRLEETQKDFTTLIKAFSKVSNNIKENLYIIGEGRHKDNLKKLVKDLQIEDRVLFLGFKNNPYPWIKNSSFFVHSSKFEGLPTVLIEASILGKAIVSTDCPTGPREILENGNCGLLVDVGDVEKLAENIKYLSQNLEVRQKYGELAKNESKRFDSKEIVKIVERLF